MKIISWNVNGLRAVEKKGFLNWLDHESPDILALQEIKANEDQLSPQIQSPEGYFGYFHSAIKKGYSGTAIYTKRKPLKITTGLHDARFNDEGRVQTAEFDDFILLNIYFPNGKASEIRLKYKLDFYNASIDYFHQLHKQGKPLLICGDYNTAHQEIDLARPKENEDVSGFLRVERDWLDRLTAEGFSDCFRHFNKDPDHYTWWSFRSAARQRNIGWRIDYFFATNDFLPSLKNCYHLPEVHGSDHCPVVLELH
ncbi:exodeoxyribonuclease III [Candidatus Gracilibacteria bacterium]|nr:exodeoxyribonuclease III [Candidatus Gracilibacteria bacterium]